MLRHLIAVASVTMGLFVVANVNGCSSSSSSSSPGCCKVVEDAGGATISTCSCGGSAQGASCTVTTTGSTCSVSCTINGQTSELTGGTPVAACQ